MTEIATNAGWADFFVAASGSSAALLGLLFVSLSINLEHILKASGLIGRAAETMMLLGAALIVALLALMPDRSTMQLGVPVLAVGALVWGVPLVAQLHGLHTKRRQYLIFETTRFALRQIATVPLVVAGVLLLMHRPAGLDWLAAGLILCIVVSLATAWILLVEILR